MASSSEHQDLTTGPNLTHVGTEDPTKSEKHAETNQLRDEVAPNQTSEAVSNDEEPSAQSPTLATSAKQKRDEVVEDDSKIGEELAESQAQASFIGHEAIEDGVKAIESPFEPSAPTPGGEFDHNEEAESITISSTIALSVDTDFSDTDSAFGSEIVSTSTSIRSSVYDFHEENGRTYHKYREGKYFLPNDELEQDRLDLQHHLFLLTLLGELFNAPLRDLPGGIHHVLDIATGTGIWAIQFASQFPSAEVIGTDLSPIQPEYIPANCHFEVDDAEDPWLYSHQFDYIHGRALATCFKSHIPVITSAFNFTRPGGYFELQDCVVPFRCIDDSLKGTHLERWTNLIMEGTKKMGKDWTKVKMYKQYLEDAGFVDVVERKYEWPVGTWARGKRAKTLGLWYREDLLSGLQGFTMAVMTRALGMSKEEVEVLLVGVREDIRSKKIHVYIPVRAVYGRKPL